MGKWGVGLCQLIDSYLFYDNRIVSVQLVSSVIAKKSALQKQKVRVQTSWSSGKSNQHLHFK